MLIRVSYIMMHTCVCGQVGYILMPYLSVHTFLQTITLDNDRLSKKMRRWNVNYYHIMIILVLGLLVKRFSVLNPDKDNLHCPNDISKCIFPEMQFDSMVPMQYRSALDLAMAIHQHWKYLLLMRNRWNIVFLSCELVFLMSVRNTSRLSAVYMRM